MNKFVLFSSIVLLGMGLQAHAGPRYSTVPLSTQVVGKPYQQMPESMAHWQQLAEDMADQAAPSLRGVLVSPRAVGVASAFDVAFHDFFVSALHRRGVQLHDQGGRVEIDTYPLGFVHHRYRIKNRERERGVAPSLEFGVTVRIFDEGLLAYSGSETYYLPAKDAYNYRRLEVPSPRGTHVRVQGE